MPARRSRTRRTVALIATATVVVGVALTAPPDRQRRPDQLRGDIQPAHPRNVGDQRERRPEPARRHARPRRGGDQGTERCPRTDLHAAVHGVRVRQRPHLRRQQDRRGQQGHRRAEVLGRHMPGHEDHDHRILPGCGRCRRSRVGDRKRSRPGRGGPGPRCGVARRPGCRHEGCRDGGAEDLRGGDRRSPGRRAWAHCRGGSPRSAIRKTCIARSARAPTRSSDRSGRSCRRPRQHRRRYRWW